MGLLAEIRQEAHTRRGPACTIGGYLETLDEGDAADLTAALGDWSIPGTAIARALSKRGSVVVKGQTVQRHRKGECSCG